MVFSREHRRQELDSDFPPLLCAETGTRVSGLLDTQGKRSRELKLEPIINSPTKAVVRAGIEQSGGILVSFSDFGF